MMVEICPAYGVPLGRSSLAAGYHRRWETCYVFRHQPLEITLLMAIILSETAAEEIKRYQEAQKVDAAAMLRMAVAGGGCSGLQYTLGFETDFDPTSTPSTSNMALRSLPRKKWRLHLDGTTIDFLDGPMGRGFSIQNPNVPRGGGCPGCGHH